MQNNKTNILLKFKIARRRLFLITEKKKNLIKSFLFFCRLSKFYIKKIVQVNNAKVHVNLQKTPLYIINIFFFIQNKNS